MILVDSSVWIDYLNNNANSQTKKLDNILGDEEIIIGDLILSEVLQGIKQDNEFKKVKNILNQIDCFNIGGFELAVQSAKNYRKLRSKGLTVRKTIDCLIATFCIENRFRLLHNDKDFNAFEEHLNLKTI